MFKTAVIYYLRTGCFDSEHGQSFAHIFTHIIPLIFRRLMVWVDLLFLCADNCVDKPLEGLPSVTRGGVPNYHFRGQVFNVKKMWRRGLLCLPNQRVYRHRDSRGHRPIVHTCAKEAIPQWGEAEIDHLCVPVVF